jgi:hypothetical protein
MDAKKLAIFLAANRLLIGAALAAVPGMATRGWIGPHSENAGAKLMARWLEAAAFADSVDLVATLAAARSLPRTPLAVGSSMAGTSMLAHIWLRERLG